MLKRPHSQENRRTQPEWLLFSGSPGLKELVSAMIRSGFSGNAEKPDDTRTHETDFAALWSSDGLTRLLSTTAASSWIVPREQKMAA